VSGIVGLWNLDGRPVERDVVARMTATLTHRGADEGVHLHADVALACRLRRTAPEAARERQPLVGPGGLALTFDGRLDNRDALLAALDARDLDADSPDPAIVLAAWRAWGEETPAHLAGDFALIVFDPAVRALFLARDAIGVRPLYYQQRPGTVMAASEVKAILAHPDAVRRPCREAIADRYFNHLMTEDREGLTVFDEVFSVLPGYLVTLTPGGRRMRRAWDFVPLEPLRFRSEGEYVEAFREQFSRAVRRRLRSAAPVAVSVSGGLDSSSILAEAVRQGRDEPGPHPRVEAWSLEYPEGSLADERVHLAALERHVGVVAHRKPHPGVGMLDDIERAAWHLEDPELGDDWGTMSAFYAAVRGGGARTLLSGHWGDQFLADTAYLTDVALRGQVMGAVGQARAYGNWLSVSDSRFFLRLLARDLVVRALPAWMLTALRRIRQRQAAASDLRAWFADDFRALAHARGGPPVAPPGLTAHGRSLYLEARSRRHVAALEWHDRMAAMEGLEVAFPFLDRDLLGFLMAVPGEVVSAGGVPKAILRHAMRSVLPERVAWRRTKAEFTAVDNGRMARDYNAMVARLRVRRLCEQWGFLGPEAEAALARARPALADDTFHAARGLGELVSLEVWLEQYFAEKG